MKLSKALEVMTIPMLANVIILDENKAEVIRKLNQIFTLARLKYDYVDTTIFAALMYHIRLNKGHLGSNLSVYKILHEYFTPRCRTSNDAAKVLKLILQFEMDKETYGYFDSWMKFERELRKQHDKYVEHIRELIIK